MSVLVTGAGSALLGLVVRSLAARGESVRVLQRRRVEGLDEVGVVQYLGDIRDVDAVRAAVDGCDAVIHGAALVGVVGGYDEFASVNIDGTRNVIDAALASGVRRVVHISTPSVAHLGDSLVGEPAGVARTGRRHGEHYSETKAHGELLALAAAGSSFGVVALRPHLVWGPGDRQLVGRIIDRARSGRLPLIGGGTALVDTTYLDNAADAIIAGLDAVEPTSVVSGRAYVVANGEPRPIRDLLVGICRAAGLDPRPVNVAPAPARVVGGVVERVWPRVRSSEPPLTRFVVDQLATAHWFDLRATHADLDWRPRIGLDEGLARLAASFR